MITREIGTSGLQASVIGLGTWAIGGEGWGGTEEKPVIEAIKASIDAGVNLIDTAPIYGFGLSETLVGKAIAGRRDEVLLATKCGLVAHQPKGDFFFPHDEHGPVHRYLGPESIVREVEQSLQRLGTDRIDLYQTHWQETTTPIASTMEALLKLKEQGKIRAIGVSNVDVPQLAEYLAAGPVASVQELYSMIDREKEADLLPFCVEKKVGFLAYSPLAMGLLTGKMKPGQTYPEGDMRNTSPRFGTEPVTAVNAFLAKLTPMAERFNVSLSQLVIAWTLQQPGVSHVLCGARQVAQAQQNAKAATLKIDPSIYTKITALLESSDLKIPKLFS